MSRCRGTLRVVKWTYAVVDDYIANVTINTAITVYFHAISAPYLDAV